MNSLVDLLVRLVIFIENHYLVITTSYIDRLFLNTCIKSSWGKKIKPFISLHSLSLSKYKQSRVEIL